MDYFINKVQYKGLSKYEGSQICSLIYRVKNTDKSDLDILSSDLDRDKMRYFLKKSNIDNQTADVFDDIFNNL